MSGARGTTTVRGLEEIVERADTAVLFVSPRILQRVIRYDRRLLALGLTIPHHECYFIARERLLDIADRLELELDLKRPLPDEVVLLERTDEKTLERRGAAELLADYWQRLFHVRVHLALQQRSGRGQLELDTLLARIRGIGPEEFVEARGVLQREELLLPPVSRATVYEEFAATFLEYHYFAPDQLPTIFPALRQPTVIAGLLAADIDHERLHGACWPQGAADRRQRRTGPAPTETASAAATLQARPRTFLRLVGRAQRAGAMGNSVKAALLRFKAAPLGPPDRAAQALDQGEAELGRLAERLAPVLDLDPAAVREWTEALRPLLRASDRQLRGVEARLLYDLQKVCLEHERGVFRLDLWRWVRSLGREPVRRRMPLLRAVLVAKHLQKAARKLVVSRLGAHDRKRIEHLIEEATEGAKHRLRDQLRPLVEQSLRSQGMQPADVPERVAFHKIVEELLDRVVERGHLDLGGLRDTLSQNDIKLQDVTRIRELLTGDLLLRIDRRLGTTLDGVYHRGPIYLRWSQTISATMFGTPSGRTIVRYAALPFGCAFLIVEGLHHLAQLLLPEHEVEVADASADGHGDVASEALTDASSGAAGAAADVAKGAAREPTAAHTDSGKSPPVDGSSANAASDGGDNAAPADAASGTAGSTSAGHADVPQAPVEDLDEPSTSDVPADAVNIEPASAPAAVAASTGDEAEQSGPAESATHETGAEELGGPADWIAETVAQQSKPQHAPLPVGTTVALTLVLGVFLMMLIEKPTVRVWFFEQLGRLGHFLHRMLVEWPERLLQHPWVRWVLDSVWYAGLRNYGFRPALLTAIGVLLLRSRLVVLSTSTSLIVFLGVSLLMNSPLGRFLDDYVTDHVLRVWRELRIRVFAVLFRLIVETFQGLLRFIELLLYTADEWLRFRSGERWWMLGAKAILGAVWSVIGYGIRITTTLLLEPQINPIKHFPVVTVSHKMMLPFAVPLAHFFAKLIEPVLFSALAKVIAAMFVFLLPGVFGFLVWELKENWRLYAANRALNLSPSVVGGHGETVTRWLRPGFHSGTIPRVFAKLRRAVRKGLATGDWRAAAKQREALHHVEELAQRFVERELIALLDEHPAWRGATPRVSSVELATQQIWFRLALPGDDGPPFTLRLHDEGGWLLATIDERGWEAALPESRRKPFEWALSGLLASAGVDLVWHELLDELDLVPRWHELNPDGLLAWKDDEYESAAQYKLRDRGATEDLEPQPRFVIQPRSEDLDELIFSRRKIPWADWVATWESARGAGDGVRGATEGPQETPEALGGPPQDGVSDGAAAS